jgi:hypothetical protein
MHQKVAKAVSDIDRFLKSCVAEADRRAEKEKLKGSMGVGGGRRQARRTLKANEEQRRTWFGQ